MDKTEHASLNIIILHETYASGIIMLFRKLYNSKQTFKFLKMAK